MEAIVVGLHKPFVIPNSREIRSAAWHWGKSSARFAARSPMSRVYFCFDPWMP